LLSLGQQRPYDHVAAGRPPGGPGAAQGYGPPPRVKPGSRIPLPRAAAG
jgi:hypothetical protein